MLSSCLKKREKSYTELYPIKCLLTDSLGYTISTHTMTILAKYSLLFYEDYFYYIKGIKLNTSI